LIRGVNPSDGESMLSKSLPAGFPALNPQVYWSGNQKTAADGTVNFEFVQPDDEGSYAITIVARDDKGNLGTKTFKYTVDK